MTSKWTIVALFLALIMAACSTSGGERVLQTYLNANEDELYLPTSVDNSPVRFEVEPGTPARTIGQQLQAAGLITDDLLFEAYVRVNGLASRLEAGTFILNPSMTMVEIVEILQHAESSSITITIPEGWRLEQVAEYLAEAEIFEDPAGAEAYRTQAQMGDLTGLDVARYSFLQERPAGTSLEGYLFPETYEIPAVGALPTDVLSRQLDVFAARVLPLYESAVASGTTTLDLYTVLTIASIVEREAVIPEERPDIAAVYLNRLAQGIRLEADPTVQYAMGYQEATGQWWKTPVFLEEYSSVISPYNTYLNDGLPPGPIASPGLSSIEAVLNPGDHDYIYFVATPDGTGAHIFASTFEEHAENVRRYQTGQ
ncbi:MAG: endolytic transglycosylase MltG [Caldilineaceae bacterium]|nr:endolytic transglycosylase MltG [Caldilineaceae bacterium]